MSRRTRVGLEGLLSLILLVVLLWVSDPASIWDTLTEADGWWVLAAIAVNLVTVPVMAWRWQILLRAKRNTWRSPG